MLSIVILYAGERDKLTDCLASIPRGFDIIIVYDTTHSSAHLDPGRDDVRVIERPLDGDFSRSRMLGMERAQHDWVLFVDVDETLSAKLAAYLHNFTPSERVSAYRIRRIDSFWGRTVTHGEVADASSRGIARLVDRQRGMFVGHVHEHFRSKGSFGHIPHPLYHTPHQSVTSFIQKVNHYSSIRAREIESTPVVWLFIQLVIYPPMKFIYTYILRGGFLDGPAGFVYSFLMALHSFLVRSKAITHTY